MYSFFLFLCLPQHRSRSASQVADPSGEFREVQAEVSPGNQEECLMSEDVRMMRMMRMMYQLIRKYQVSTSQTLWIQGSTMISKHLDVPGIGWGCICAVRISQNLRVFRARVATLCSESSGSQPSMPSSMSSARLKVWWWRWNVQIRLEHLGAGRSPRHLFYHLFESPPLRFVSIWHIHQCSCSGFRDDHGLRTCDIETRVRSGAKRVLDDVGCISHLTRWLMGAPFVGPGAWQAQVWAHREAGHLFVGTYERCGLLASRPCSAKFGDKNFDSSHFFT